MQNSIYGSKKLMHFQSQVDQTKVVFDNQCKNAPQGIMFSFGKVPIKIENTGVKKRLNRHVRTRLKFYKRTSLSSLWNYRKKIFVSFIELDPDRLFHRFRFRPLPHLAFRCTPVLFWDPSCHTFGFVTDFSSQFFVASSHQSLCYEKERKILLIINILLSFVIPIKSIINVRYQLCKNVWPI